MINEKGEAERRFLQDWLDRDLTALSAAASPRGARLVLVNYYGRVDWLEEEFERFAARHDAIAADVWRFGIEGPGGGLVARKFLSPDKHPNEQGYARVASLVRDVLVREKIIP
ncbi:MAG: hypothetical protein M5R36_25570 [Deltaproteobacteria bacterium]|nr:hypothetical protein [Deltaproteobacteria bacterium]